MILIILAIVMNLSDNNWCFKNFSHDEYKMILVMSAIGILETLNALAIYHVFFKG